MYKLSITLFLVLFLFGCMVGPNYHRPKIDIPQAWRFEDKEAQDVANLAWWKQLNDPVLDELVQTSLQNNKDLMIASARVEEFIGRYRVTRGSLFPEINAGAVAGRDRVSEKGPVPLSPLMENPADTYQAFFNGSWEIDLWGKLRRATEAARADLLSTEEGCRGVILTLVATVANAYIDLRDLDQQLEIAKRTAKTREENYKIFKLRFEAGIISELELSQVKSEYENALAVIPQVEKIIAQQENSLSILLGKNPGPISRGKTIDQLVLPVVPGGLPSELLERRPDIRQAEQNLIAANARIGVARAAYFPNISLTANYGYASTELSDLFNGPAKVWNWSAPITAPIFSAGRISGAVKAATAQQQQALFIYQQTIQNAFREVDDGLIDQNKTHEQLQAQGREVEALKNYAHFARLRYDEGYTSYIDVLDAERRLFSSELSYTQTQGTLFRALVNLYKAMGGGWVDEAEHMTTVTTGPVVSGEQGQKTFWERIKRAMSLIN
jgi:multidrug efflux system outer membrane protein